VPVNEVHQPMRQVSGEIRPVIAGPILLQASRNVNSRIPFRRELDVGIRLVIAQQDVIARLPLLDQVVLERQSFLFVVDLDKFDLARVMNQRAGFDVRKPLFQKVAANTRAQVFGLPDVDDSAVSVFV